MQSQKTLIIISAIAIILFISAFIWNNNHKSNAEVVNYDPIKDEVLKIKKIKEKTKEVTIDRNNDIHSRHQLVSKEKASRFRTLLAFYPTPDDMFKAIVEAQESGNEQKEDDLIELILRVDPDYKLPKDLKVK